MRAPCLLALTLAACGPARTRPAASPSPEPTACTFHRTAAEGLSDADQVTAVFHDVQAAARDHAPCALPDLVDAETLRRYEVLRQRALEMPREDLEKQPLLERTLVLEMRQRLGTRLRDMTGATVLAAGIDPPPRVLDVLVEDVALLDVQVTDGTATAGTSLDGTTSPRRYRFVKDAGGWKLDLMDVAEQAAPLLARNVEATGRTEDEFIDEYLAARSGREVTDALWDPVGE